jgi:glycerol-3-phosphate acyltransferase PlsX
LLDVGANSECKAHHLVQFAIMGDAYSRSVLGTVNPSVGLMSIGEEEAKGNDLTKEAFPQLRELSDLNFVGNVEAHEMIGHVADVVVCDGFVGNVVIKLFEGLTSYIFRSLRTDLQQGPVAPLALLALKPGFERIKQRFDYEKYGGSPLLGVRGVSIVTHGRAKARMVEHAIGVASDAASANIPSVIAEWSRSHRSRGGHARLRAISGSGAEA